MGNAEDLGKSENCSDCDKCSSFNQNFLNNLVKALAEECMDVNVRDTNESSYCANLCKKLKNNKIFSSKSSNLDALKNSVKRNNLKNNNKTPLYNQEDLEVNEIIKLLRGQELSKDKYELALQQCKKIAAMSPELSALLNSIIPHNITETILPIFQISTKENCGVTESSGYSSNDDNHLRHSALAPALNEQIHANHEKVFNDIPLKPDSILQSLEDSKKINSICNWKKEMKFNGRTNFGSSAAATSVSNCTKDYLNDKNFAYRDAMLGQSLSGEKSINGLCQKTGPFKCIKCKRIYRTSESFDKHSESCNFILDSSSEESDGSVASGESNDNASFELIQKKLAGQNRRMNSNELALQLSQNKEVSNLMASHSEATNGYAYSEKDLSGKSSNTNWSNAKSASNRHDSCSQSFSQSTKEKSSGQIKVIYPSKTQNVSSNQQSLQNNATSSLRNTAETNSSNFSNVQSNNLNKYSTFSKNDSKPTRAVQPTKRIIMPTQNVDSPIHVDCNPLPSHRVAPSNVGLDISPIPMVSNTVQNTYPDLNAAICNNGMVPMACNTLIIPPNGIPQANPVLNQIAVPQSNFIQAPIDLNPASQLSYVGSITITNNETMSLAVNVPEQFVPMFSQQDINYSMLPSGAIQIQQPNELHLSTMNVQHISVQSSFSTGTLDQIMFPQQAMSFSPGQVMFVEDPIQHHLTQVQQPSNFLFQVPIEQSQNCGFTAFVPQAESIQPHFVNQQYTLQSNVQQVSEDHLQLQQDHLQLPSVKISDANELNKIPINNNSSAHISQPQSDQLSAPKPTARTLTPMIIPITSTGPSSSSEQSGKSVPAVPLPPNNNLVDILKKAAEQMLNMSAKKTPVSTAPDDEVPEKKTRFAHTRKVAARKAEKLRQKTAMAMVAEGRVPVAKPKSMQFKIATLKPGSSFSMPFVPVSTPPSTPQQCASPVPVRNAPSEELLFERPTEMPAMPTLEPEEEVSSPAAADSCSDIYQYDSDSDEEESPILRKYMEDLTSNREERSPPKDKPYILYEIDSEDGLHVQSTSLKDAWMKVYNELHDARIAARMKKATISPDDLNELRLLGLDNPALIYLLEQLPGAESCPDYDFIFHRPCPERRIEIPENKTGSARSEPFVSRRECDMFNFLASEHRPRPVFLPPSEEEDGAGSNQKTSRRSISMDLPIAMRFQSLKTLSKETVGVYRSSIHGRGLFCKRNIDAGELVIEYAGEVIRSFLTDKRERIYQSKGIGCYMFRIDDEEVVDATMHGNAARFINHSCEPNCFSKVITVDCKKHIVIFALRRISKGEELTYDYKFPFEEEKIPCHCNTRRCRKYLN